MKLIYLLSLLFLTTFLLSCDPNRVYEDTASFKQASWQADSIKFFEFVIPESKDSYNIRFSLRNGRNYPHSNIYVQYRILDSTQTLMDEELRSFPLFHQKSGYPFGKGSGNIYEHNFDLLNDYRFPYSGKYLISVQQYMRYDSLPEIYSVGIRIENAED